MAYTPNMWGPLWWLVIHIGAFVMDVKRKSPKEFDKQIIEECAFVPMLKDKNLKKF